METSLQMAVALILVVAFVVLLGADVVDDFFFGNRWRGVPPEMFALIGSVVVAVFGVMRRSGNGKRKEKEQHES